MRKRQRRPPCRTSTKISPQGRAYWTTKRTTLVRSPISGFAPAESVHRRVPDEYRRQFPGLWAQGISIGEFGLGKASRRQQHDLDRVFPSHTVLAMGDLSLFGLVFPEEYGGAGAYSTPSRGVSIWAVCSLR